MAAVVVALASCGGGSDTKAADGGAPPAKEKPGRCDWEFNTVGFWSQNPPTEASDHVEHMGNTHGAQPWKPIVDRKQCATLEEQFAAMDAVVEQYPTAQSALDAGCYRATVYVPGIAAHYVCRQNFGPKAVLEKPLMLLYGGSAPTAPIVGLSYMIFSDDAPNTDPDAELWAQYMPWHYHSGLCTNSAGLVIGGDNSDPGQCEARGGKVGGRTGWMGHYWLDNCPSPDGVFSADNPRLDPEVGRYNDAPEHAADTAALVAAPCQGSKMVIDPQGDDRFGKPKGMSDRALVDATPAMDHEMDHSHDATKPAT